jgi:prepilin-type N-terminal cleavage/methylation domain-containing protein
MRTKRGFTLIELLVVIAIIAILASILFPVFAKAREKARQTTCTSQLRQLATAVLMYNQDNGGTYPGTSSASGSTWVDLIGTYVGNSVMFHCPSDANTDVTMISYAYSALLVRANKMGVAESQVTSPSDVGVMCDADSSAALGGLVGGGAGLGPDYTKTPSPRHSGVIIGYCDGHAKFAPGSVIADRDMSSPVNRAFYMAGAMGWVDNLGSGIEAAWPGSANNASSELVIGGDYCTRPILVAAAEIWKYSNAGSATNAPYTMTTWKGEFEPNKDTQCSNAPAGTFGYLYGCGDGACPQGSCIAVDALVFIVALNSKIQVSGGQAGEDACNVAPPSGAYIGPIQGGNYAANTATISYMYQNGMGYNTNSAVCYQCYDMNARTTTIGVNVANGAETYYSGTRKFVMSNILSGTNINSTYFGPSVQNAVTVYNDVDMVNKVASDPYGIGYCSAAFADTNRVTILGLACGSNTVAATSSANQSDVGLGTTAGLWNSSTGGIQLYPSCNAKQRWILPDQPSYWPLSRQLYATATGGTGGVGSGYWTAVSQTFENQLCFHTQTTFSGIASSNTTTTGTGLATSTNNFIGTLLLTGPQFHCSYYHQ